MHRMHVHPPPPKPERLVMRKDEAMGNKKTQITAFFFCLLLLSVNLNIIIN
jgi:hypothetical protein